MEENIEELRRAYGLLKQIYENNFIIKSHLKVEIEELMIPQWMEELENEKDL
jgi:hypothetical protein